MAATIALKTPGWMRSLSFDLNYIVGIPLIALTAGYLALTNPALFALILTIDLWFLGYHHVISTFTRLTFDAESFRENRFLVLVLPFVVLAGVVAIWMAFGVWAIVTVYLYWQWFHYTRQSYGISKIYRRKATPLQPFDERLTNAVIYSVALWGILYRSAQRPAGFLFGPVKVLPVPFWLAHAVGALSVAVMIAWTVRQIAAYRRGEFAFAHALYMASHVVIFLTAYILIPSIDVGWLVVNIWHNLQYILLVWMYNTNRFKNGIDPKHWFLSAISQFRYTHVYFAVCIVLTTVLYKCLEYSLGWAAMAGLVSAGLPLLVIAYQAINFHHYIVDSVIWKVRKPKLKQNLGLANS